MPAVGTGLHTLAMTLQGTNLVVTFDGTVEISANDASPFTSGGITVEMYGDGRNPYTLGVDNVTVTSLPVLGQ